MNKNNILIELDAKFVLETICQQYSWNYEQLLQYKSYLLWDKLSMNRNMNWSEQIIDEFCNFLDFRALINNNAVLITPYLIEKHFEKWDWTYLADNPNIPWSIELMEKYVDHWSWESIEFAGNLGLSSNPYLPWSEDLLDLFKDKWFWGELSSNPSLPWSLGLIRKYEKLWTWDGHFGLWGLSVNPSPIVRNILLTYYPERIDKKYFYCNNAFIRKDVVNDSDLDNEIVIKAIMAVFDKNINHADTILSLLKSKL